MLHELAGITAEIAGITVPDGRNVRAEFWGGLARNIRRRYGLSAKEIADIFKDAHPEAAPSARTVGDYIQGVGYDAVSLSNWHHDWPNEDASGDVLRCDLLTHAIKGRGLYSREAEWARCLAEPLAGLGALGKWALVMEFGRREWLERHHYPDAEDLRLLLAYAPWRDGSEGYSPVVERRPPIITAITPQITGPLEPERLDGFDLATKAIGLRAWSEIGADYYPVFTFSHSRGVEASSSAYTTSSFASLQIGSLPPDVVDGVVERCPEVVDWRSAIELANKHRMGERNAETRREHGVTY